MGSQVRSDILCDPLRSSLYSNWMNNPEMRAGRAAEPSNDQHYQPRLEDHQSALVQMSGASSDAVVDQRQQTPRSGSVSQDQPHGAVSAAPVAQISQHQPSSGTASSQSTLGTSSATPAEQRPRTAQNEPPPSPRMTPSQPGASETPVPDAFHPRSSQMQDQLDSGFAQAPISAATTAPVAANSIKRIKVRDLQHIQTFAQQDPESFGLSRARPGTSQLPETSEPGLQYEISEMPVTDVIEMVAGLLTKITTTNDRQHEHLHRNPLPDGTAALSQQTSSVLSFHGKNVPSITILSYLTRIHKYCPTTYEIFLSLLVYFDRMTERVNSKPLHNMRQASQQSLERYQGDRTRPIATTGSVSSDQSAPTAARAPTQPPTHQTSAHQEPPSPPLSDSDTLLSHFFVVDSFNIHRLVIAGVTCASKFFSDVFYTNSRYAKVGGLPLVELNHLELQFLLLNNFRLSIPVEELEAYATMLVEFYAREYATQQAQQSTN